MRALAAALLVLAASVSSAAPATKDRVVRVRFNCPQCTNGDTIPSVTITEILFIKEPCPLQIVAAPHMYRAWTLGALHRLGCWAPKIDGRQYLLIDGDGNEHDEDLWQLMPEALIHSDGSVVIAEPGFVNSADYTDRVLKTVSRELVEQLRAPKEVP